MSTNDDGYVLIDADPTASYFPQQPLFLPQRPLSWALDRIDTALGDIRAAGVTGWRSALADTYRSELEDLTRDVARARDLALEADRAYAHLRYAARTNGQ